MNYQKRRKTEREGGMERRKGGRKGRERGTGGREGGRQRGRWQVEEEKAQRRQW